MTSKDDVSLQWAGKSLDDMEYEERAKAISEMRKVRDRLGQFTLRFMMEAIYGDEYTKAVLGESGGNVLMRDIQVETTAEGGSLKTTINEKQLRGIMMDAQKGKTKEEIQESNAKAKRIMKELADFTEDERATIMKFMKKVGG